MMRLPAVEYTPEVIERVLCGTDGIFGEGKTIHAENIDLSLLPTVSSRKSRTHLAGLTGEVVQFFSNGDRVCIITRADEAYSAQVWNREGKCLDSISLGEPLEGAFLYAHAWRGERLYLPAFCAVLDTDTLKVFYTNRPLVTGEALMEYRAELANNNRHIIYFLNGDFEQYALNEYVLVEYSRLGETLVRSLFVRIVSIDTDTGAVTVEGEGAPDLLNADPGKVTLRYDIPELVGVFSDHERLYGFERNYIHISAKGEKSFCFTTFAVHDTAHAAVTIEMEAEITGGCMYRGRPYFFTDGAVIRLVEDVELGFRVLVVPTVGVTPRAVTSPTVIGDKICYFSRHGLALFNGREGRVVRAELSAPQGGAAVADGRFYSFFATGTEGEALYAYDAEEDLLYSLGSEERIGISFALGGVLVGTDYTDAETNLVVFAERDSLPYPISAMVEDGVLYEVSGKSFTALLAFGEDRSTEGDFSPYMLLLDAELGEGSLLSVSVYCDGAELPIKEFSFTESFSRRVQKLICPPRHCQSYRVELRASGDFRVFDIRSRRRV